MNKFNWKAFKEDFVNGFTDSIVAVVVGIGLVYLIAWISGEPANNLVGWIALGMAAGAGSKR
jgi:hypothetical protein